MQLLQMIFVFCTIVILEYQFHWLETLAFHLSFNSSFDCNLNDVNVHLWKIVEFIAVLLRTNSDGARKELVSSGAIQLLLKLFFDYPFNNILHHQVESIVSSCLESNNQALLDHLFQDCDFVAKLLAAEENPFAPGTQLEVITSLKSKFVHYHGCNFFYI
jgi:hypothetical protein